MKNNFSKSLFILAAILFVNMSCFASDNWSKKSEVYVIKKEDSWSSIEKKFSISQKILKNYNNLKKNYMAKNGDKITIPAKIYYPVKNGESALSIAKKYGMSYSDLITINNINDPEALKTGSELKIIVAKPRADKITNNTAYIVNKKLKLNWPVEGKVVSKFGLQANGTQNNDIHILIKNDQNIKAAASGTIVYAGNEIGDYGNLVIIQHPDEYFSSYGNLSSFNVNKGDIVKSGQIIGIINSLEAPQPLKLYFGLRIETKAVDPLKYLKNQKIKQRK